LTKYNIDVIKKVLTCIENESKYDQLTEISKTFYSDIINYINDYFDDSSDNVIINKLKSKEKKLLKQLLIKLFDKRISKVFDNELFDIKNLTEEEIYVVKPFFDYKKRLFNLKTTFNIGNSSFLTKVSDYSSSEFCILRIKNKISQTLGADLGTYGPFENEDVVILPMLNAYVVLNQGLADEYLLDFF